MRENLAHEEEDTEIFNILLIVLKIDANVSDSAKDKDTRALGKWQKDSKIPLNLDSITV